MAYLRRLALLRACVCAHSISASIHPCPAPAIFLCTCELVHRNSVSLPNAFHESLPHLLSSCPHGAAFVGASVLTELKRIVKESEIVREDDKQWPEPDRTGRQEFEARFCLL